MIIGFDGATLDLIRPWADAGYLPTFKRLMSEGTWGPLQSIMPPVTPASWNTMATGMNQGKHGLFDFFKRKERAVENAAVNATHRHGDTLWSLLSEAGYRVSIFNVPASYPPDHVNGSMVCGLLTPANAQDATWPCELQRELEKEVPEFNFAPPGIYSRGRDVEFVQSVRDLNATTLKVTRHLMEREPWDFMVTIFMGTDIISHFMWQNMETGAPSAPKETRDVLANAIRDCYRDMDAALSELIQAAGEDAYIIAMSDHGFGKMDKYMAVNAWLIDRGYIRFKQNPLSQIRFWMYRAGLTPLNAYDLLRRLGLGDQMRKKIRKDAGFAQQMNKGFFLSFRDVDWTRTRAYSNGHGGPIFVNLKGREPHGVIEPGSEYDRVIEELIADLRALKEPETGLPFAGEIFRGRDIYNGEHSGQAPDLLFFPRDPKYAGLGLVEFPTNEWLSGSPDRSGNHRLNGVVFLTGPGIQAGKILQDASIMDVAPTVLSLMGVPIPEEMDGHILEDAMTPDFRNGLAVTFRYRKALDAPMRENGSEEQTPQPMVQARLQELGYID